MNPKQQSEPESDAQCYHQTAILTAPKGNPFGPTGLLSIHFPLLRSKLARKNSRSFPA